MARPFAFGALSALALGAAAALGLAALDAARRPDPVTAAPPGGPARPAPVGGGLHFASNLQGDYAGLRETGFNLADVGFAGALDGLPPGLRGVLWLGNGFSGDCAWRLDAAEVAAEVLAARDHPAFSGIYYIADEPTPSACPGAAEAVAARTALVHAVDPRGLTFVVVRNGASDPDEFRQLRDAADLIGVPPYPCTAENADSGCDLDALRARIRQALDAGLAPERIVPVFQAFGQACTEGGAGYYRLPDEAETLAMLAVWDEMVPPATRAFDMVYSWGPQARTACPSLKMADGGAAPDLRSLYRRYFAAPALAGSKRRPPR